MAIFKQKYFTRLCTDTFKIWSDI